MKNIRIYTLYSGSSGNSTFIRVGNTAILIDAGRNAKALRTALAEIGEDLSDISAIFITHEHCDHISALDVIAKKNDIPIYVTRQSAVKFSCDSPVRAHLCERDILFSEDIGDMHISSFQTSHDSLMSVGYKIEYSDDDGLHAIGYATDTGYISDGIRTALLGCDAVVLECNHDVDMLMRGPYPYDLKRRVASRRGHLSNNDCADFSLDLVQNGTRAILLAHVSRENNDPTIAFDTVSNAISGFNVNLAIAEPFAPTELVIPKKED
jgi:phosphoribosyl 1,2-cyclic phosphodiesterase